MLVVRGTKKLRDRGKGPVSGDDDVSTGVLGDWFATALFWKPKVALAVNARTFLPVFVPLAPAEKLLDRLPDLLRLRDAFYRDTGGLRSLREACIDLFAARYAEAEQLWIEPRPWPPQVVAYPHWHSDYASATEEVGIDLTLDDAAEPLNEWIAIDAAS